MSRQVTDKYFSGANEIDNEDTCRIRRSIGGKALKEMDPFILLDHFYVHLPSGFVDHPHRGYETVTYVLPDSKGSLRHQDCRGADGFIGPGEVHWVTAGKGVMHAEMPFDIQPVQGLQLWLNLDPATQMCEPE